MEASSVLTHSETTRLLENITQMLVIKHGGAIEASFDWLEECAESDRIVLCQVNGRDGERHIDRIINHGFDSRWVNSYTRRQYAKIDPVLSRASRTLGIFDWELAPKRADTYNIRIFIEHASSYGLCAGVTCSCHVSGKGLPCRYVCSICGISDRRLDAAKIALRALVPAFAVALEAHTEYDRTSAVRLTPKEREVLIWASEGKGVWEISKILAVSQSTIKFHFQNIYRKLNVSTRAHAIALAIQQGIIRI